MMDYFNKFKRDRLTVSEMSKLRNISIDTLKHYDRIGLLKPAYVNPQNQYRYYSAAQYDIIGLIIELRQLGMSLKDIKKYIENRNLANSLQLMEEKGAELKIRVKELAELSDLIQKKIQLIKESQNRAALQELIIEKVFPKRYAFTFFRNVKDDIEGACAALELEQTLHSKAPTIAAAKLGAFIPEKELSIQCQQDTFVNFIFIPEDEINAYETVIEIPNGKYLCSRYFGTLWQRRHQLNQMLNYINSNGLTVIGDGLQINIIDETVTENENEFVFEIQIPIA
ncbi:MerR family transcriptional regulator [bacterium 210820-DFI.6.37]|nr:MerR family transcriptional regulator [bacterium 210820-DFI.6.37]